MRNRVNLFCALIWAAIVQRDLPNPEQPALWKAAALTMLAWYGWQAFKAAHLVDWSQKVAAQLIEEEKNNKEKPNDN